MSERKAPPPPKRPLPKLDAVNRPFWTGGDPANDGGKLFITHCRDCGEWTHPPREFCRHCQSENVGPQAVPGTGAIDTLTVNHQAWVPGLKVPFVIARVRLDGVPGVVLTTNIVGSPVDEVGFEDRVKVTFEEQDGVWFPLFAREG